MAITKVTNPYELLVRWNEVTGKLQGAHLVRSTVVMENGELLGAPTREQFPLSIDAINGELWAVLNTSGVSALADSAMMLDDLAAASARIAKLEAEARHAAQAAAVKQAPV